MILTKVQSRFVNSKSVGFTLLKGKKNTGKTMASIKRAINLENNYCIYKHTNLINGKVYIGQTCQLPEKRFGKNGNGYKGCRYFYNAIECYGWNNFKHEIISVIGKGTREAKFYLYTPLLKKIMENSKPASLMTDTPQTPEDNLFDTPVTVSSEEPEADADYSAVDAALATVPSDLTKYTDSTAAAVTAAGMAQVAQIRQQSIGGGSSSVKAMATPQTQVYQPEYTENPTGDNEINNLRNSLYSQTIRGFVVESDITESQRRANIRNEESTF